MSAVTVSNGDSFVAKNLAAAQFTTVVDNREPVDNISSIGTDYSSIYFFTDVRDCKGCKIEHEWWHKGVKVSTIKGKAKYDRYRYWSKKTLTENLLGDWTVKVRINGSVKYTKTITYHKATLKQKPIKNRVQTQESSECELQLRYFSDKTKAEPDDKYFKFMLDKWGKRCLPE